MTAFLNTVSTRTVENSGKTASRFAVLPVAGRPAVEDFRGERDVVR